MISDLEREIVGRLAVGESLFAPLAEITLAVIVRVNFLLTVYACCVKKSPTVLGGDTHDHAIALVVPGAFSLSVYELFVSHNTLVHFLELDKRHACGIDGSFSNNSQLLNFLTLAFFVVPFEDLMIPWLLLRVYFHCAVIADIETLTTIIGDFGCLDCQDIPDLKSLHLATLSPKCCL